MVTRLALLIFASRNIWVIGIYVKKEVYLLASKKQLTCVLPFVGKKSLKFLYITIPLAIWEVYFKYTLSILH